LAAAFVGRADACFFAAFGATFVLETFLAAFFAVFFADLAAGRLAAFGLLALAFFAAALFPRAFFTRARLAKDLVFLARFCALHACRRVAMVNLPIRTNQANRMPEAGKHTQRQASPVRSAAPMSYQVTRPAP
jgi:hypothetical protein